MQAVSIDSPSTPFRIVANTYLRDPKTKKSVNCILANGPNLLSDSWVVSLLFRTYIYTLCCDVSKTYHKLLMGLVELQNRRVLHRSNTYGPWVIYSFT